MNIAASLRTPARLLVALLLTLALLASAALTALPARAASLTGSASSLTWGFYEGWRTYIANGGSTVASDGAVDNGATYAFGSASAALDPDTGAGQASFDGTVNWLKPAHGINIAISDPRVEFAGGAGSIYWTIGGSEVLGATIGTVALGTPVASGANSTVGVTGSNVYFTAAGAAVFGSYSTTTHMDDVSFAITYATPTTAAPTTVTLSSRTAAVVTGGGVALSATVSTGVAGSVQFFDGATSVATVAVAGNTAATIATATTAGSHSYTAVFTPTDAVNFAPSTSPAVVVTAAAAPAALVGNVSGATLDWGFSHYANFAATNGIAASGWPVSVAGGPELLSPTGSASLGFRLTGGTGSVITSTGVGAISFPGSVTYIANGANAAQFTLSGFVLTVTSPTEGTLTGYVSTKATSAATAVVGATPVTMATFDITSLSAAAGTFTLQSADPDFVGTVAAGTYNGTNTNAWPASFIAAIDSSQRSYFYQSGGVPLSQGNINKPPLPISASYTATSPTTTTLDVSSTSVVAGGGVRLRTVLTTNVAGSVEFFDGSTSLGTVAAATAQGATTATYLATASAGSHSYRAVFTPTLASFGQSSSATVTVTTITQAAPLVGNVSGATLDWGFSNYAAFGSTVATAASGWPVTAAGGPELISAVTVANGTASQGFRLTGGTGSADPVTGIGAISFPGSVTYSPYGSAQPSFKLSDFVLTMSSATEGTLTAYMSTKANADATAWAGPAPVTVATFDIVSLTGTAGAFALQSAAPDYAGTVASGTYSPGYSAAYPVSFIQAMDPAFKSFFYQSGTTQGNLNKPPLALSASFTASTPSSTTLDVSSTSVVAGGGVRLRTLVTTNVEGAVEFFDGSTSLGTVTTATAQGVTSATMTTTVSAGSHGYRAVFTPASSAYGQSTSATVTVTTTTQFAALSGNVSGAELQWGVSNYAAFGSSVATAAGGWPVTATGGPELISPVTVTNGTTSQGFRLTGGTGAVDPVTAIGAISFPGSVTYAPYGPTQPSFTLSGFVLSMTSATEGTLTGYLSTKANASATLSAGLSPVTFATFDITSLVGDEGDFTLQSAAPDYAATVVAGTYSSGYSAAYPASFIQAMDPVFRSFFYQSGTTQGNLNKPPLAITAEFHADAKATSVSLSASQTAGLLSGDAVTVTANVTPTAAAGTVTVTVDGTQVGTGPAGTPLVVSTGALAVGTHTVVATFTPTNAAAYAASAEDLVLVVDAPAAVPAGSLAWAIYSPFNAYVTGFAAGSISTSNGASAAFRFEQSTGSTYDASTGLGSVTYRGAVRYLGHGGALDLTLSNPVIRITSATAATLYVTTGGAQVAFASLNLGAVTSTANSGAVTFAGVPATLLSAGAAFFGGNYPIGTAIAPVTFTIGSASAANPAPSTIAAPEKWTAPDTPPATTGLTVDGEATEGEEITVTGTGFAPNEEEIHVIIYSSPMELGRVTADSTGTATWTGELPAGLTGEHTLTLQGSVSRGVVLDIQAAPVSTTAIAGCPVTDATITWGFKESFRSYISGSIANGQWTVADGATYETPNFGWADGTGAYDPETSTGELAFAGSIDFTGHSGALNTVVANPVIVFEDADTAVLKLDISGTTQEGDTVSQTGVEFVELDLSAATVEIAEDGTVTITNAPTTLTDAGAAAFGTYEAGEAFDPITVVFSTGADCAVPAEDDAATTTPVAADEPGLGWLLWVILALVLIAVIVAAVVIVRRRSAN